jgi:LmbE family N-acetylglucosaminyl deacetylase
MMKNNYIKRVYISFKKIKIQLKWFAQFNALKKERKIGNTEALTKKRFEHILIIAPHADDELIGCFQFIKNNLRAVRLFYCGFTGGNIDSENISSRAAEFEKFCKTMKVEYVVSSNNIEIDLKKEINEYGPDAILIPSFVDWHLEHRKVNHILSEIIEHCDCSTCIMWYQISVPMSSTFVNCFEVLNKRDQDEKWDIFYDCYKTQKHLPIKRFRYAERLAGQRHGVFAGEEFSLMSAAEWRRCIRILQEKKNEMEIDSLSESINDLFKVRSKAEKIFTILK